VTATTTVLLVDDQELVRAGFRIILQSEPGIEVVGEAANGTDAVRLAAELNPDVICMDVQMPGMDGLEATRRIVADPAVTSRVLILTTFDRDDYLFEALSAGASGFLLKSASPENLVEGVQVLARGDALLSPGVTRRVIERLGPNALPVHPAYHAPGPHPGTATIPPELTERETEVLVCLARGRSNAEIAAELFVGEATVKTHVSNVLTKLGVRDRIQAVVYAYENGIAVRGADPDPSR
jgi:DNA-binding NarL/FixJ family response regulator